MLKANILANEAEWVAQVVSGNREAYGHLVRAYQDRLFNAVVNIVPCRADAEDVVQEAFIQAYARLDTFQGKSSFYTWVYRIAINMALTLGRRRKTRATLELSQDVAREEPLDKGELPGQRLARQEDAEAIRGALDALCEEHRVILILRGVEGLDYAAIAELLDLNPGTVRSRLHRARNQLRRKLEMADCSL